MPPLSRPRFRAKLIGSANNTSCGGGSCFRRHSRRMVAKCVLSASRRVGTNSASFGFDGLSFDAVAAFVSGFGVDESAAGFGPADFDELAPGEADSPEVESPGW